MNDTLEEIPTEQLHCALIILYNYIKVLPQPLEPCLFNTVLNLYWSAEDQSSKKIFPVYESGRELLPESSISVQLG